MKDVRKLLSRQSKDILPDASVKESIKQELGYSEKSPTLAYAHGGQKTLRKNQLLALCAAALLLLCCLIGAFFALRETKLPISEIHNKFEEITDADSFYAYGAASVGTILSSGGFSSAEPVSALSGSSRAGDERVEAINKYMALVESLLSENAIQSAAVEGKLGYAYGMTVTYTDLLGETVDVPLGGKRVVYPAPPPRLIYVDVSLLCGAAEAYGKICSWALSLLDLRFSPDDQPRCGELYELALSALGGLGWYESDGVQKIFESDFRLAYCAREGLERGAVRVLAEETGSDLFALVKLAKVYELFFRKGYARPYAAPDYVERAERAGVRPHPLFCRADAFYADFLRERRGYLAGVREILSRLPNMKRTYFQLGGKGVRVEGEALRRAVDLLPEKCEKGPLVWMREFGLLEGLCKGRCKS